MVRAAKARPMSSRSHVVVFACGAALLVGCPSKEEEVTGPWRSGLAIDATLAGVSDLSRRTLCKSLDDHLASTLDFDKLTRLMCSPGALLRGRTIAGCDFLVDACMRLNAPDARLFGERVDEQRCERHLVHCGSSVGALETCINVNVAHVLALLEGLSCDRVGDRAALEQAARSVDITKAITTCAGLAPACQNVIEDAVVR
jgi:hypothetical protein